MLHETLVSNFAARLRGRDIPVRIRLWNGREARLGRFPKVTITVPGPQALRHFVNPTLDALGAAYVEGELDVDGQIDDVIDIGFRLAATEPSAARHGNRPARSLTHSPSLDAEAIAYHYDVSNEFYSLWLDSRMVYSCAYFESPDDNLENAQLAKLDHILTKLRVRPGDRLLDLGCGWGALIQRAAENFGADCLGITLSKRQYELANERIAATGLGDRCQVRLEDYRSVSGTFDRIASVGMFEHVGLANLDGYFSKVRELMADGGTFLNHGITTASIDSAPAAAGGGRFIDRYVFPHGELAHLSLVMRSMATAGLEPLDIETLRRHYTLTLTNWLQRFEAASARIREVAGEKRFRIWRLYLAGCAHAFAHNQISLHQILAVKSGSDFMPLTRDYMYRQEADPR